MYADYTYYTTAWGGTLVASADYAKYESRAEDVINQATMGKIVDAGLVSYTAADQEYIKKAVCAQVDYFGLYGLEAHLQGVTATSFTVGKVSVSSGLPVGAKATMCPAAKSYLEQTGLLYNSANIMNGGWW